MSKQDKALKEAVESIYNVMRELGLEIQTESLDGLIEAVVDFVEACESELSEDVLDVLVGNASVLAEAASEKRDASDALRAFLAHGGKIKRLPRANEKTVEKSAKKGERVSAMLQTKKSKNPDWEAWWDKHQNKLRDQEDADETHHESPVMRSGKERRMESLDATVNELVSTLDEAGYDVKAESVEGFLEDVESFLENEDLDEGLMQKVSSLATRAKKYMGAALNTKAHQARVASHDAKRVKYHGKQGDRAELKLWGASQDVDSARMKGDGAEHWKKRDTEDENERVKYRLKTNTLPDNPEPFYSQTHLDRQAKNDADIASAAKELPAAKARYASAREKMMTADAASRRYRVPKYAGSSKEFSGGLPMPTLKDRASLASRKTGIAPKTK